MTKPKRSSSSARRGSILSEETEISGTPTSLRLQSRKADRAIGPAAIGVPIRGGSSTDCDVLGPPQSTANLTVGIKLLLAFFLVSSIRLRAAARAHRGRIAEEWATRKKWKGEWQQRRNPPVAGGAVCDPRRCRRLGRGSQLKLSRLGSRGQSVCRLIPTPPAAGPVRLPNRAVYSGWAGVLIGGSRRCCRRLRRLGPGKERFVPLCLGGLSLLIDLVRRAEIPTIERLALQACGIDWLKAMHVLLPTCCARISW